MKWTFMPMTILLHHFQNAMDWKSSYAHSMIKAFVVDAKSYCKGYVLRIRSKTSMNTKKASKSISQKLLCETWQLYTKTWVSPSPTCCNYFIAVDSWVWSACKMKIIVRLAELAKLINAKDFNIRIMYWKEFWSNTLKRFSTLYHPCAMYEFDNCFWVVTAEYGILRHLHLGSIISGFSANNKYLHEHFQHRWSRASTNKLTKVSITLFSTSVVLNNYSFIRTSVLYHMFPFPCFQFFRS